MTFYGVSRAMLSVRPEIWSIVLICLLCSQPANASANAMTISASQGIEVFVTDTQGRQTGFVNGSVLTEIPDSSYVDEQSDLSLPVHHVLSLLYPLNAVYTLTIIGVTPGPARIDVYRYFTGGNPQVKQTMNVTIALPGQTFTQSIRYSSLAGDLNGDGKVDCADIAIVKAAFGKRIGQVGYDPVADTNNDGIIDIRDLAFVSQHLQAGTKCP